MRSNAVPAAARLCQPGEAASPLTIGDGVGSPHREAVKCEAALTVQIRRRLTAGRRLAAEELVVDELAFARERQATTSPGEVIILDRPSFRPMTPAYGMEPAGPRVAIISPRSRPRSQPVTSSR